MLLSRHGHGPRRPAPGDVDPPPGALSGLSSRLLQAHDIDDDVFEIEVVDDEITPKRPGRGVAVPLSRCESFIITHRDRVLA